MSDLERRAKETIDPYLLESDASVRDRVLTMRFEEVVERLGFVEYKGVAKFTLARNGKRLEVIEDSLIQHGLHGSFRVLQLDREGDPTREAIFHNGVFFVRNGAGQMRVQGIIQGQDREIRDEAWQSLRVYTGYFGQRLGLEKVGPSNAGAARAAEYTFKLANGPELVSVEGMGTKRPKSIRGKLLIDEATGVPIMADLKAQLEIPAEKPGGEAGALELSLEFTLKPIEGVEIKPKSFVPTITRHPVDLDPLRFLDGGTRTSTTIGGKR